MVPAAYLGSYARREGGIGKGFIELVGRRELIIATTITILLVLFFFRIRGMYILIGTIFVSMLIFRYLSRKFGGMTGDTLGAIGELIEAFFLISVVVAYPAGMERYT